jgi:serine/threonine-protein kinase
MPRSADVIAAVSAALIGALWPLAATARPWGAVAYSRSTGESGYSYSYATEDRAKNEALSECAKAAADCRVLFTVEGKRCAAFAVADNNDTIYLTEGSSEADAAIKAKDSCMRAGGKNCTMEHAQCASRSPQP